MSPKRNHWCDDPRARECEVCAERDCPYLDEAHYSKDGCPTCGPEYPDPMDPVE